MTEQFQHNSVTGRIPRPDVPDPHTIPKSALS